ncbi:MAG: hypothetical protein HYX32_11805 [Actinobacteria bacterium]|nr:hypothetical protein [Actinomycetota bacterium]
MNAAKKMCMITAVGLFGLAAVFAVLGVTGGSLLKMTWFLIAGSLVFGGLICVATGYLIGGLGGDSKLLQTGMPGTAVIVSLQETGMVINYTNQVLNIGLRVQVGSGTPYDVTVRQAVPMIMLARCMPGATIGVKVDPNDRAKVVIDWSMVSGVTAVGTVGPQMAAPPPTAPQPAGVQYPNPPQ